MTQFIQYFYQCQQRQVSFTVSVTPAGAQSIRKNISLHSVYIHFTINHCLLALHLSPPLVGSAPAPSFHSHDNDNGRSIFMHQETEKAKQYQISPCSVHRHYLSSHYLTQIPIRGAFLPHLQYFQARDPHFLYSIRYQIASMHSVFYYVLLALILLLRAV